MSLPSLLSTSGRLAPLPFVVAAIVVYLASFGSQVLLSAPVTARMSVVPFSLVQAALIWLWLVLHARRLHDAGRPAGLAVGIAIVYALEVVLLVIVVWLMLESGVAAGGGAGRESTILHLFVILYLMALLSSDPALGALQIWIIGFVALMLLPVAISLGFSLWAATRTSAPSAP
ncbi:MAG: hypothetical protein WEA28_02355 [Xanthobacteraceae bacterium]